MTPRETRTGAVRTRAAPSGTPSRRPETAGRGTAVSEMSEIQAQVIARRLER